MFNLLGRGDLEGGACQGVKKREGKCQGLLIDKRSGGDSKNPREGFGGGGGVLAGKRETHGSKPGKKWGATTKAKPRGSVTKEKGPDRKATTT